MKKIIVSQRIDYISTRNELRECIDSNLIVFLKNLGYLPYTISNFLGESCLTWVSELKPSGIILSGGNNIGEYIERDQTEKYLLDYSIGQSVPVIGICRGMQFINHYQQGTLNKSANHVACRHTIDGDWAAKKNIEEVNSYHDNIISQLGHDLEAIAFHQSTIEALIHQKYHWLGIMWHPEREIQFKNHDQKIFKEYFG